MSLKVMAPYLNVPLPERVKGEDVVMAREDYPPGAHACSRPFQTLSFFYCFTRFCLCAQWLTIKIVAVHSGSQQHGCQPPSGTTQQAMNSPQQLHRFPPWPSLVLTLYARSRVVPCPDTGSNVCRRMMDGWGEVAALLMMGNTSTYNISYNYPPRIQTIPAVTRRSGWARHQTRNNTSLMADKVIQNPGLLTSPPSPLHHRRGWHSPAR